MYNFEYIKIFYYILNRWIILYMKCILFRIIVKLEYDLVEVKWDFKIFELEIKRGSGVEVGEFYSWLRIGFYMKDSCVDL